MKDETYEFKLGSNVAMREAEESLLLAVLAAEGLHGRAAVRLDASFHLEKKRRSCAVNAGTQVGRDIALIFTGFLIREFGEDSFTVRKFSGKDREA